MEFEKNKVYRITAGKFKGEEYVLEGLWIELTGKSWMDSDGNPACLEYAMRTGMEGDTRFDDNVYYGHIGNFGKLIHKEQLSPDEIKKEEVKEE